MRLAFRFIIVFLGVGLILANAQSVVNNSIGYQALILGPLSVFLIVAGVTEMVDDIVDDFIYFFSKKKQSYGKTIIETWYESPKSYTDFIRDTFITLPKNLLLKIIYFPIYLIFLFLFIFLFGWPVYLLFYLIYLFLFKLKKKLLAEKNILFEIRENKFSKYKLKSMFYSSSSVSVFVVKGLPYDDIRNNVINNNSEFGGWKLINGEVITGSKVIKLKNKTKLYQIRNKIIDRTDISYKKKR